VIKNRSFVFLINILAPLTCNLRCCISLHFWTWFNFHRKFHPHSRLTKQELMHS